MFEGFAEFTPMTWGILAVLLLGGITILIVAREKKRWSVRMIANGALSVALAFILFNVRLYNMPQGGCITPASMLPILLFAFAYGAGPGILVGVAYGLLEFIQAGYYLNPVQFLLDYTLAFGMLGLAGFVRDWQSTPQYIAGIVIGFMGRFLCAFLSGIVFYGEFAPEGQPVWLYSIVYNGLYLIPEAAIVIVAGLVPQIRNTIKTMRQMER